MTTQHAPALIGQDLSAGYNGVPVIHGVSLKVNPREIVLLAGANGAGKTTTVRALSGAISTLAGRTELFGVEATRPLHFRIRAGMAVVTESRTITMGLTVKENLRLGRGSVEKALDHFPELRQRLTTKAGLLSGGEQQMVSLARVLAAEPGVILVDELSQGLAPIIVKRLLAALREAADAGAAVLLVEQHIRVALSIADRAYLMRSGQIQEESSSAALRSDSDIIRSAYL
jgi:branched-chain amino acid transport system ATP-binding protein